MVVATQTSATGPRMAAQLATFPGFLTAAIWQYLWLVLRSAFRFQHEEQHLGLSVLHQATANGTAEKTQEKINLCDGHIALRLLLT